MARKSLREDQKKTAEYQDEYFAFSFDFQKVLPFPILRFPRQEGCVRVNLEIP